ncbi:Hypoxia-inducible factor 1-alpha [Hyphodiscus hymeniophilus]|uniref:Hypoxia-inducible factor 1-alpha n=1 Tax=Hyphodiscus hymeniophilus TaxID=353542 RepID=A0A9P6VK76_9HELO|nr:Hypoxia-inducible factor 1-alpha [Hyphodiscus hymeniophilus]
METTFMTIHNLSAEANILFASDSITDVLGYRPHEVIGRSCFDYFHSDEVPFARQIHDRGVRLEKAAVLNYARVRGRNGGWIGCECVFTVTYDVLVACTSIYHRDEKSGRRAVEAPAISRLFASSPKDPRYHMLEHLSSKFRAEPAQREPRAAIILNRFTRTLTVMYATDAIQGILGVTAEQFKEKSFYECIQENCLPDAIRCLESAKANDSIAYLRFWYRDPRRAEDFDEEMREASLSSDSDDGGVELHGHMDIDAARVAETSGSAEETAGSSTNYSGHETSGDDAPIHGSTSPQSRPLGNHRTSSEESRTDLQQNSANAIFDREHGSRSQSSSLLVSPENRRARPAGRAAAPPPVDPFEIEAVVSCTSDGLVVVMRRARPIIPTAHAQEPVPMYPHGLFAAPWGGNPILPHQYHPDVNNPFVHGFGAPVIPAGGPPEDDFMNSIREVAVFAWSLTGINGNIASYGHGVPRGESQPPTGLPIWDPYAQPVSNLLPPINQAEERWLYLDQKREITNFPVNEKPFVHAREELRLREHHGFGMGPMGSDRPGSSAHRYLGDLGGYVFQGPGNYQNNRYDNIFGHMQDAPLGHTGPAAENAQPPSTQRHDPSQGPREVSRRNLWY